MLAAWNGLAIAAFAEAGAAFDELRYVDAAKQAAQFVLSELRLRGLARRALVHRLSRGPARVTDLAAPFPISLAAVSKHLKVLERARLVRRVRAGREFHLALRAAPLREVARWTARYQRFWTTRLEALEAFLGKE